MDFASDVKSGESSLPVLSSLVKNKAVEGGVLNMNICQTTEESTDSTSALISDVKIEDTPIGIPFPFVKSEAVPSLCEGISSNGKITTNVSDANSHMPFIFNYSNTQKTYSRLKSGASSAQTSQISEMASTSILQTANTGEDFLHEDIATVKEESTDYSRDFISDIEIQKTSVPMSFEFVKTENVEESLDMVAVKEELNSEETLESEVPSESITFEKDGLCSQETWNACGDTFEENSVGSLLQEGSISSEVPACDGSIESEILVQLRDKNIRLNTDQSMSGNSGALNAVDFKLSNSHLKAHSRSHTSKKTFKCDVCGRCFTQSYGLKNHLVTHSGDTPYKCDVCGKSYRFSSSLSVHVRLHTGDKPFKCDVCGKRFSRSGVFRKHILSHTDNKPFNCDICGKGLRDSSNLKEHLQTHSSDKPFKCDHCGKCFKAIRSLKMHLQSLVANSDVKPFKCDVCGKRFSVSRKLKMHFRYHTPHTGDKPFKCDVCFKCFRRPAELRSHLGTHTDHTPFKCDVCGKCYRHSGTLRMHLRLHTGYKPYKCDVCGKCYSQLRSLKSHLLSHTGHKPFKCDVCGKCYSQSGSLNTHLRLHAGDKPFKCDVCGKCFIVSSRLKVHLRSHWR